MTKGVYSVYQIRCKANNRCYIGQTKTLHKRWGEHLSSLSLGNHKNSMMQEDFKTHKCSAFEFAMLDSELSYEDSVLKEADYVLDLSKQGLAYNKAGVRVKKPDQPKRKYKYHTVCDTMAMSSGEVVDGYEQAGKFNMTLTDFLKEVDDKAEQAMTATHAASAMGLSLGRLKQLLRSGEAPRHLRWNSVLVFKHSDINAWKQGRAKCKSKIEPQ